jgi:hypothetical protein
MMATMDGNGGDSDGNGNASGNSNDAATAANSNDVDDNNGGNLRTEFGQQQSDKNNGTTII